MTALSAWSANCHSCRTESDRAAFGPTTSTKARARGDRVLNLLVKRQPARHRNAVKPNLETAGCEIPVQPDDRVIFVVYEEIADGLIYVFTAYDTQE